MIISPVLGPHCRHVPSCSHYTIEALREWGFIKGFWLGLKRVLRCHPWGTHGYDPVPKRRENRAATESSDAPSKIEVDHVDPYQF